MLNLIAISPLEGAGYVKEDSVVFLIKKPYTYLGNKLLSNEDEVEKAVATYGFTKIDKKFPAYSELLDFLKQTYITALESKGIQFREIEKKDIIKFITNLPKDKISSLINKIENDFLSNKKFNEGIILIEDLLNLTEIKGDMALLEKFQKLKIRFLEEKDKHSQDVQVTYTFNKDKFLSENSHFFGRLACSIVQHPSK